jgi:hypothetical protein
MKRIFLLVSFAVVVLGCSFLPAQDEPGAGHAPDADTFEIINNIMIPAVQHAPFSSVVTAEWTKTLEDGSTLTRQNHRMVMRDGAGRIYQERRTLVPKGGKQSRYLLGLRSATQRCTSSIFAASRTTFVPSASTPARQPRLTNRSELPEKERWF